jgi:integrase
MGRLKGHDCKKRFHDLRHSAATILLVVGVHPKVVQERLGHSTIAMTMDSFSHVLPSMQQEVADKIDDMLSYSYLSVEREPQLWGY